MDIVNLYYILLIVIIFWFAYVFDSKKKSSPTDKSIIDENTNDKDRTEDVFQSKQSLILKQKKIYANEFYAWTKEEDKELKSLLNKGNSVSELSVIFERSEGVIIKHMQKLKLRTKNYSKISTIKTKPKIRPNYKIHQNKVIASTPKEKNLISKFGKEYLYHITHIDNLHNIYRYGLQSHNIAHSKKYIVVDISNKDVNRNREKVERIYKRKVHDYVPLFFNPVNAVQWAMAFVENQYVILGIDKKVLFNKNSLFTDGNAANRITKYFNDLDKLSLLDWNCINSDELFLSDDRKRKKCTEVLVFPEIKTHYIKKIFCRNEETKTRVENIVGKSVLGNIEINESLFIKSGIIATSEFEIDD